MNHEYELLLDEEHNQAIVNNIVYDYEIFLTALKKQNEIIINNNLSRKNISLVDILKDYPSQKCRNCGKYSPMVAPQSGYSSKGTTSSNYMGQKLETAVSVAGLAAGALVLSKVVGTAIGISGAFTPAQVKNIISQALRLGATIGASFYAYYKPTLYYHPICPKAVKMYKSIYVKNSKGQYISTNESANLYYYYINPN